MNAVLRHRILAGLLAGAGLAAVGFAWADALPGHLPLRREPEPGLTGGFSLSSVLLLGLAVAAGGYALWRLGSRAPPHFGGSRAAGAVTRRSSQALTPHASVHAVQWNGEEFLLGCTAQQVTLLARRPLETAEGGAP